MKDPNRAKPLPSGCAIEKDVLGGDEEIAVFLEDYATDRTVQVETGVCARQRRVGENTFADQVYQEQVLSPLVPDGPWPPRWADNSQASSMS